MERCQYINVATQWENEKGSILIYTGIKNKVCIDVYSNVGDGVIIHKELAPEVARDVANELLRLANKKPDDD